MDYFSEYVRIILLVGIKNWDLSESFQSLNCAEKSAFFYVFIPTLLFELLLQAVLSSLSLSLIFFLQHNFSEFADHQISHIFRWTQKIKAHYAL